MQRALRVDTAGVQRLPTHWGVLASELAETVAPAGVGLSCQTSAAAVNSAHLDVAAFTAGLVARVSERATGVAQADASFLVQEAASATVLAAVAQPAISV